MKQRKMTVSRIYQQAKSPEHVPSIRLTGQWVADLGFAEGSRFVVREQPGRIELIATKEGDAQ